MPGAWCLVLGAWCLVLAAKCARYPTKQNIWITSLKYYILGHPCLLGYLITRSL